MAHSYNQRFRSRGKKANMATENIVQNRANENMNQNSSSFFNALHKQSCKKLFLDEKTADIHFLFNQCDSNGKVRKIAAHKIMLAKGSDVFQTMFFGSFEKQNEIEIVEVTPDGFKTFLQFFYLDRVELTMEFVAEVIYLADKYLVKECKIVCEHFLMNNFRSEYFFVVYPLSITHSLGKLKSLCESEIDKNPRAVIDLKAFYDCSQEVLKYIMDIEALYSNGDGLYMFNSIMAWAEHKCVKDKIDPTIENRRNVLGDAIYRIPFYQISRDQLSQFIANYRGLFNSEELEEILIIGSSNGQSTSNGFKFKTPTKLPKSKYLDLNFRDRTGYPGYYQEMQYGEETLYYTDEE